MLEEADPQSTAARTYSRRERIAASLLLAGLLLGNVVVFALLGRNYLDWYIAHGTEIGLAFAFVAVVVDLDRYPELISDAPWEYAEGARTVVGLTTLTIGTAFERPTAGTASDSGPWSLLGRNLVGLLETLAGGLIAIGIVLAAAAWLVVVAPIQYVVNLVCGEPARSARESRRALDIRRRPGGLEVSDAYVDQAPSGQDTERMSLALKPVAFTNTVAAGVLWFVERLL
jgi:hypothetical protein